MNKTTHVWRKLLSTAHCWILYWNSTVTCVGQRQLQLREMSSFHNSAHFKLCYMRLSSNRPFPHEYQCKEKRRNNNMQNIQKWAAWNTKIKRYPLIECNLYQPYQYILHCYLMDRIEVIHCLCSTLVSKKARVLQELLREKESVLFLTANTNQAVWTGKFFFCVR